MGDFSRSRKGDPCFSMFGIEADSKGHNDTIQDVDLTSGIVIVTGGRVARLNGLAIGGSQMPVLYHSKPVYDDPPPPKRMVKKWARLFRMAGRIFPVCSAIDNSVREFDSYEAARDWADATDGVWIVEVEVPEE